MIESEILFEFSTLALSHSQGFNGYNKRVKELSPNERSLFLTEKQMSGLRRS